MCQGQDLGRSWAIHLLSECRKSFYSRGPFTSSLFLYPFSSSLSSSSLFYHPSLPPPLPHIPCLVRFISLCLSSQGSIFLDGHKRSPELILPVGEVVVVSTNGSMFYVFDAQSALELRRFDVTSITKPLGERTDGNNVP